MAHRRVRIIVSDYSDDSEEEKVTMKAARTWLDPLPKGKRVGRWRSQSEPKTVLISCIYGSHAHYNNLLADVMKEVRVLLAEEKSRGTFTTSDKRKLLQAILHCYFKYLKIYMIMDLIFDQMVHPQKRLVIRKFVDLLVGRLLELQSQLVLCENSEICYFDEIALVEGVLPKELDMPIPRYYYHDPTPEIIQRDQWFLNVQERERRAQQKEEELQVKLRLKMREEAEANGWDAEGREDEQEVSFEDTVLSLQVMERARQGKGRFLVGKFYYDEEMPMGSVEVHRMVPLVTKSVLICGPPGSGKKTIVNMVCTELRATLIDLTASNIAGKYPGKPGLKMLIHLIEKVGRAVPPVIILIDNCEKTYMKKVPKTDKTEPKRLKKQIGKFLKTVNAEDLILLIGLSSEPWQCPFKVMKKDYQRVLYIPPADFGTRFEMWKEALGEHHELLHPDINFTLLTKLSHGWTVGNIRKACEAMIQAHQKDVAKQKRERRKDMDPWGHLGNFVIRPVTIGKLLITMDKLVESIGEYDPVFMEQEKMWNTWWNKTPMQKAQLATQVKAGPEKKEKKKGKKKK